MKLAFLFSDGHHTLHLVSGQIPAHKPTKNDLEMAARDAAISVNAPYKAWDFVGALKNGRLAGPMWFEPKDE